MIKLKGNFWYANGEDIVYVRVILYIFIGVLQVKQWKFYGNFNFRSSVNILFFEYDFNIVFGMQFFFIFGMQFFQLYFIISFNSYDLLRLIGVLEGLVFVVRNIFQIFWLRGI